MERKTKFLSEFTYDGFGFPVELTGRIPVCHVRGTWVLDLPQTEFEASVALALANAPWRLTGHQVHFLRHFFGLTLKDFGARFGDVSHACVIQWQKAESEPTSMNWAIEKDLRLAVFKKLLSSELEGAYDRFTKACSEKPGPLRVPVSSAA